MLSGNNVSALDVSFAYQCLNGIIDTAVVSQYFGGEMTNSEIVKKMRTVLDRINKSNNTSDQKSEKPEMPRKMVIT